MDSAACARSALLVRPSAHVAVGRARRPVSALGCIASVRSAAPVTLRPRAAFAARSRTRLDAASGAAAGSSPAGPSGSPSSSDDASDEQKESIQEEAMPVWIPGPNDAPPPSWEKNPLKEFSKIPLDLVVLGTLWALFLSELLRFVCEVPAALPTKVIAGAMLAFCFNGGMMTGTQLSRARAAEAAGHPAQTYRFWTYVKAVGCLCGLALAVLKLDPAPGLCLFYASNVAFLTLNSQGISKGARPALIELAEPAKKLFRTIALLDLALLALTVGSWRLLEAELLVPSLVLAGLVAAFAAYQSFEIHVQKKGM